MSFPLVLSHLVWFGQISFLSPFSTLWRLDLAPPVSVSTGIRRSRGWTREGEWMREGARQSRDGEKDGERLRGRRWKERKPLVDSRQNSYVAGSRFPHGLVLAGAALDNLRLFSRKALSCRCCHMVQCLQASSAKGGFGVVVPTRLPSDEFASHRRRLASRLPHGLVLAPGAQGGSCGGAPTAKATRRFGTTSPKRATSLLGGLVRRSDRCEMSWECPRETSFSTHDSGTCGDGYSSRLWNSVVWELSICRGKKWNKVGSKYAKKGK